MTLLIRHWGNGGSALPAVKKLAECGYSDDAAAVARLALRAPDCADREGLRILRYPSFRMAPAFTARQGEYLRFIHRYTEKFGVAPSFEDVGNHFGTTPPSVNNMIKTLCARGLLSKLPGVARSLRVLVPASQLPEGEFGASRGKSGARANTAAPSTADVAATTATAVLDVLMPHVVDDGETARLVVEAAQSVRSSLVAAGASDEEALEAYRRVYAEVARWMPDGRGLRIPRKEWTRR